jgi:hypothetical protein
MRHALTFLNGFLDHPRGTTVLIRDYAAYRAYRAGRSVARRLRSGGRTAPARLLGPDRFAERWSDTDTVMAERSSALPGGAGPTPLPTLVDAA